MARSPPPGLNNTQQAVPSRRTHGLEAGLYSNLQLERISERLRRWSGEGLQAHNPQPEQVLGAVHAQGQFSGKLQEYLSEESVEYDRARHGPDECCCICLEDYSEGDVVIVLQCKHIYHTECIRDWHVNICPTCKAPLLDQSDPAGQSNLI